MGVYFDDLDPFRILHNARYILLFERTLGSFWEEVGIGSLQDDQTPDYLHLVRANSVQYLDPFRGTGRVRVRVWIRQLGRTSLVFGFKLMPIDRDSEHATGERVIVHVDAKSWRPAPWTEEFRRRVRPWVESEESSG